MIQMRWNIGDAMDAMKKSTERLHGVDVLAANHPFEADSADHMVARLRP